MTATQILTNKLALKMLRGFLCLFRTETMCKWQRFNSKNRNVSTKIGTGKLGRISTEKQSQTSNREGSRADH